MTDSQRKKRQKDTKVYRKTAKSSYYLSSCAMPTFNAGHTVRERLRIRGNNVQGKTERKETEIHIRLAYLSVHHTNILIIDKNNT